MPARRLHFGPSEGFGERAQLTVAFHGFYYFELVSGNRLMSVA